ncbi:large subunit ribosomal protein L33 [Planotetraspora sp. GP83]
MKTVIAPVERPIVPEGAGLARNELRPVVKLRSTAGTGFTYITRKNRRNDADRLSLRKYDPIVRQHVVFKEAR